MTLHQKIETVKNLLLTQTAADFRNLQWRGGEKYQAIAATQWDLEHLKNHSVVANVTRIKHIGNGILFTFELPDAPPEPIAGSQDYLHTQWSTDGVHWSFRVTYAPDPDSTRVIVGEGIKPSLDAAQTACRVAMLVHMAKRKEGES